MAYYDSLFKLGLGVLRLTFKRHTGLIGFFTTKFIKSTEKILKALSKCVLILTIENDSLS